MMFHHSKFVLRKPSRLLQDLITYRHFSDVVQSARKVHFLHGFFIKSHIAAQPFRILCYTDGMGAGEWRFVIDDLCKKARQLLDLREA